jgi:disulfide bond formation protein DsbB
MLIKKIYLVLGIVLITFLSFKCGGDNKSDKLSNQTRMIGNPVLGKDYYMKTCAACHGNDGKGLPKLGKDLTTSQFVIDKTNQELVDYVKIGRLPSDPLNTTGVAMPPKGGNPTLTDKEILDIVTYVRSIHN